MNHEIGRTENNAEDICLNCGQTGSFTDVCPQPKENKILSSLKKNKMS